MDRYAALTILLLGGSALAKPPVKKAASRALHVRSIDLARRYVMIELSGMARPPAPNMFTFIDERDRHFVGMGISCEAPLPSGALPCALEMPAGYERHRLAQLGVHLGNLHGRTLDASEKEIDAAWSAAEEARVMPGPSPSPMPSPRPKAPSPKAPSPSPSPKPHK